MLEESLLSLGDSGAVPGGEQIQQQAAGHGHTKAGVRPGGSFIGAGLDQGVGDRRSRACEVRMPERTIWYMFHLVQKE